MKFDCGPTPEEREAARKAEAKRRKLARQRWHRVFAWWPKRVGSHDCRWLEWIERREVKVGETMLDYHFGALPILYLTPQPVYAWEYRPCQ